MWILPKQLHTSDFVPDTEALSLDLSESSQLCAQSLFVRSKPSPLRTWSQKWKRDSWTQHLFGRILKPSHGTAFVTAWTSLLEATPASHSVPLESEQEQTTQDTCGPLLQMAFKWYDPNCASSRMWKDTLALDYKRSLQIWKALVTKRRGEYSARLNAARLTSANEFLSWPTATTRDWKDTMGCSLDAVNPDGSHRDRRDRLMGAIAAEMTNWPTPDANNHRDGTTLRKDNNLEQGGFHGVSLHHAMTKYGQVAQGNHSTHGSRPESWATPIAGDSHLASTPEAAKQRIAEGKVTLSRQMAAQSWATPRAGKTTDENLETWAARQAKGDVATMPLTAQVKAWATPRAEMDSGAHKGKPDTLHSQIKAWASPRLMTGGTCKNGAEHCDLNSQAGGKLNPRWVETLMGLPVGWTMPSCASPVTIAQTSCASLETE